MNSNKQKKKYLKAKRKQRAERIRNKKLEYLGYGRVKADPTKLTHINSYGGLPYFYEGRDFKCRDCGAEKIWTAKQQKFYYEECKGHIDARAVRCKSCRNNIKQDKTEQWAHMLEMNNKFVHPNDLFFNDLEAFKAQYYNRN
jgi:hypothetical protein